MRSITNRVPAGLAILLAACGPRVERVDLPSAHFEALKGAPRAAVEKAAGEARRRPDDASAVAAFGMALHAHGQFRAAAQAYQRAASLEPGNARYLYYWGTALAADGRNEEAVEPLREAARSGSAPVRLKLADTLYAAGRIAEAEREYRALLTANPDLAAAHFGVGRTKQGEEAVKSLTRAIELFPRYGAARFALASVYRQMGKRAEAEKALENYERDKLIAPPLEDPDLAAVFALDVSSTGLLRRAQSAERSGDLRQAAAYNHEAVESDPKLLQGWINLISLHGRLGEVAKAEEAFRKATAIEPRNAEAHYNFGVLCVQTERYAEAQRAFEQAVAADPNHAEAMDNLGALLERSGETARAVEMFRRAAAAKPTLQMAFYHLGRSYASQRRYPEAIAALEKAAVPENESNTPYLYALGAVHARAGNRAKAIEILTKARSQAERWKQEAMAAAIARDLEALRR